MEIVQGGWFLAGSVINLTTDSYTFMKDILVKGVAFSDTIDLGSYKVDSSGRLVASIDTSQLPVGNHVLVLEGQTYSGEPVTYYQFVGVLTPAMLEDKKELPSGKVAVRKEDEVSEISGSADANSIATFWGNDIPRHTSFDSVQNEDASSSSSSSIRPNDSAVLKADDSGQGWRMYISMAAVIVGLIMIGGVVHVIKAHRY